MTSSPTATIDPPPMLPPRRPHRSDRFFAWVAGIGIVRSEGWIGGVCAGIASRLRVDPLIVRGIFVVAAVFGLPMLLAYALAWALLPDLDDRIHARELLHGRFQPVQVAIVVFALLGLVPTGLVAALLVGMPGYYLVNVGSGFSVIATLAFLVGLVLVGGLIFLIVRAARRTPGALTADLRTASADSAAPDTSASEGDSGVAAAADGRGPDAVGFYAPASDPAPDLADSASADRPEPELDAGATPTEIAEWRAQHAAWREQDQAWRRQQQDAERAAREQARRERQAAAAVFAAEAAERRRVRRASNPRTSGAYVATTLGIAAVVGAVVALATGGPFGAAAGLFAGGLIVAIGMALAGILRRRSGFLAFVAVLLLLGGAAASIAPLTKDLTLTDAWLSNADPTRRTHLTQPWGWLYIEVIDTGVESDPIVVRKRMGDTQIRVEAGTELHLKATVGAAWIQTIRKWPDGSTSGEVPRLTQAADGSFTLDERFTAVDEPTTRLSVTLEQTSGSITIWIIEPADTEEDDL